MAKVINLFEGRNQEKKNDWRKTLIGRDKKQLNDGEVLDKKLKGIEDNLNDRPDLPLSNEVLKELHLKDIAFLYFAEEGACGTPGNLAVYTQENGRGVCYAGNYVYDDSIEAKNVNKLIRPLIAFAGEGKNTEAPFKHYYMGMGNHWYVNKAYVKDVDCIKEVLTEDGLFARKKAVAYMLLDSKER